MKSLKNKKGFTLVELVIVIAVIGILAAILIPTFSTVVENAKEASALSEAKTAYTQYLTNTDGNSAEELIIVIDNKNIFVVVSGQVVAVEYNSDIGETDTRDYATYDAEENGTAATVTFADTDTNATHTLVKSPTDTDENDPLADIVDTVDIYKTK